MEVYLIKTKDLKKIREVAGHPGFLLKEWKPCIIILVRILMFHHATYQNYNYTNVLLEKVVDNRFEICESNNSVSSWL